MAGLNDHPSAQMGSVPECLKTMGFHLGGQGDLVSRFIIRILGVTIWLEGLKSPDPQVASCGSTQVLSRDVSFCASASNGRREIF